MGDCRGVGHSRAIVPGYEQCPETWHVTAMKIGRDNRLAHIAEKAP